MEARSCGDDEAEAAEAGPLIATDDLLQSVPSELFLLTCASESAAEFLPEFKRTPRGDLAVVACSPVELLVEAHDAEIDRIVALGARIVDDRRGLDDGGWVVFADPEDNEFCLLPTPAEQAGVSRT